MAFFFFFVFVLFFIFFFFLVRQYHSSKQIRSSSPLPPLPPPPPPPSSPPPPPSSSSFSSSLFNNTLSEIKYDVFLSFRGVDTRNNFTSHLYSAFRRKQIETFIDDKLIRGEEISPCLLQAIKQSMISVVIFSEGYASSRWCLKELVKILKCKKKYGQIVIPIFYCIDPSDVRNQTGMFGVAFSKLEKRFRKRLDKLQKWRIAMTEAANLSGFDSRVIRSESELIEKIVEDIVKRLNNNFRIDLDKNLVGMESRIKEIQSLLSYTSIDVHALGIWGIGGIGKTTIAREIFNQVSSYFEGSCFIENVREEFEKIGGLTHLRWKLLSTLLNDENVKMDIPNINFDFRRLSRKKVLIVFDDVTSSEQVKSLIGSLEWFMRGSLIIITSKDKQVFKICGVKKIYKMKELVDDEALELFSRHAFNCDHPEIGYEKLSYKVIQYCQGLPLALRVIGGMLYTKDKKEWESAINKLKKFLNADIQKVLKISYDNLDRKEKNIFLDIACFFKGEYKYVVTQFLDACGFSARIGITSLIDKGLIAILDYDKISMHDLVQEMGKEIVRQESDDDPDKYSRLWNPKDIYDVLKDNTGTEVIQGISFDMSEVEEISLNFDIFEKMHKLRFLKFYGKNKKFQIYDFGGSGYIFTKLRYLEWEAYPLKSLPSKIQAKNLTSLKLMDSKVEQLWDGVQSLFNLRNVDLRGSNQLTKLPDLSKAQNLENLNLVGCSRLVELHSSMQHLDKLVSLDLDHCRSLKSLPEISSCKLERLCLNGTALKKLPSSIDRVSRLYILSLEKCSRLEELPRGIGKLKSLQYLNISGCLNLQRLPDEIGNLDALESLLVDRTAIREVPSSIVRLYNLEELRLNGLSGHEQMGHILPILLSLDGLCSLSHLELIDCGITELPETIGQLSSLGILNLEKNNFERIPKSIMNLSKLLILRLSYCERLQSLPNLPCSLIHMDANHCTSLEALSGSQILFKLPTPFARHRDFILDNCYKLDGDELKKIVEENLHNIQLLPSTWWGKVNQILYRDTGASVSYPGSEIPEWFKFQSSGSSVTLDLPPGDELFNNKCLGLGFCVVAAFEEHHNIECLRLWYELKVKTEDGDWHFASRDVVASGRAWNYVDLEHVHLGYMLIPRLNQFRKINEVFIHYYFKEHGGPTECCDAVKKCGIRLLYAQNMGE